MAGPSSGYYRVVLFSQYGEHGWSEGFDFKQMSLTDALDRAYYIARLRSAFFELGDYTLKYAVLKDNEVPRWSIAAIDRPMEGSYTPADGVSGDAADGGRPNLVQDALNLRVESVNGKHATRLLRAMEDYAAAFGEPNANSEAAFAGINADASPTFPGRDGVITNTGVWSLVKYLRNFLVSSCAHVTRTPGAVVGGVQNYVVTASDINRVVIRGLTTRRTGRPFGSPRGRRMS